MYTKLHMGTNTDEPLTTKVNAHTVRRGDQIMFGDEPRLITSTEWVTKVGAPGVYEGVLINGIPFLFNHPLRKVVGGSTK